MGKIMGSKINMEKSVNSEWCPGFPGIFVGRKFSPVNKKFGRSKMTWSSVWATINSTMYSLRSSRPRVEAAFWAPMKGVTRSEWNRWVILRMQCSPVMSFLSWRSTLYGPSNLGVSLEDPKECSCSRGLKRTRSPGWYELVWVEWGECLARFA